MIILMDVDLTICDNSARRLNAFSRGLGRELSPSELQLVLREEYEQLLNQLDPLAMDRVIRSFLYDLDLFELDRPFPDAAQILELISRKHRLFYVSGRPLKQTIRDFLERFGFPLAPIFNAPILPQQGYKKQELYAQVIRYAGTNKGASVGDLIWDAIAAKRLGLYAIGTCQAKPWTRARLEQVCDYVIQDLRQLPQVISELEQILAQPGKHG